MSDEIEEFVAYNESSPGFLLPIIAIQKPNGTSSFRDMVRNDLKRIPDDISNPGGWLFKKSNSSGAWARRFVTLRGNFMFYFRSPQAERPVGIIPLSSATIGIPKDTSGNLSASEGFEFEIRNYLGHIIRMYSLSAGERDSWISACRERVNAYGAAGAPLVVSLPAGPGQSAPCNIFISTCMLTPDLTPPPPAPTSPLVTGAVVNPFMAPPLSGDKSVDSRIDQPLADPPSPYYENDAVSSPQSLASSTAPPPPPAESLQPQFEPQQQTQPLLLHPNESTSGSYHSNVGTADDNIQNSREPIRNSFNSESPGQITIASVPVSETSLQQSYQEPIREDELSAAARSTQSNMLDSELTERMEIGLMNKFMVQREANEREAVAHERHMSASVLAEAREIEQQNPLRLAELFRMLLFFVNEEMTEDPVPENPVQIPHLKGIWAENMLVSVYKRYCNANSGFMSLEELVEFLEQSAILKTHTPRDSDDEALPEFKGLLDPIQLLTSIPRSLGAQPNGAGSFSDSSGFASAYLPPDNKKLGASLQSRIENSKRIGGTSSGVDDAFLINFTQFYELLLRITQICYAELWEEDKTVALNKILQESILPLYVWSLGHSKLGSEDCLVREERIPLLLITYAPNIWRVFLFYAQDVNAKVPEFHLQYPEAAQEVERLLFGIPNGAPVPHSNKFTESGVTQPFIITQSACIRLCQDYGIIPYLVTKDEAKSIVQSLNSNKPLIARKHAHLKQKRNNSMNQSISSNSMYSVTGQGFAPGAVGGLGFSEFIEFIARIAVVGMKQPNYHILFPTDFSKVLSILTVWGVADLNKLEEVRAISLKRVF